MTFGTSSVLNISSEVALPKTWGRVVVADQQEGGDSLVREPDYAPGELPLVGLRRVAALVGVAAEQHEVDAVVYSEVDGLVEGVEEVHEPGRQAGFGVYAAVVLDPYVYVGKVEDGRIEGDLGML